MRAHWSLGAGGIGLARTGCLMRSGFPLGAFGFGSDAAPSPNIAYTVATDRRLSSRGLEAMRAKDFRVGELQ